MSESCYGQSFVASLGRQLETARAEKKTLAERLAAVTGERDDLAAQNEQDIQGHGALNARLFGDLRRLASELDEAKTSYDRVFRQNIELIKERDDAIRLVKANETDRVAIVAELYEVERQWTTDRLRAEKAEADLVTVRADLKATRQIGARNLDTLDEQSDQIEKLRKYLSDAACARDRFAVQVHDLKAEILERVRQNTNTRESRICPPPEPAPTHIDTVVLTGWNGMTMTQDHNGTILRRTS